MTGFQSVSEDNGGRLAWYGHPDDDAAHRTILGWLETAVTSGFVEDNRPVSNRVTGNLGEFIAYKIGEGYVFVNDEIAVTANAWDPISDISQPGLDIVWLRFGATPAGDWAAIQEVKTTGQSNLSLADRLVFDYDKLFGENLRVTLRTRLDGLKNRLEQFRMGHLAPRITSLGGSNPNRANGVHIVPTLIHDSAYDSSLKMTVVRQALIGKGWSTDCVCCWSVGLDDINSRLNRLARGES